jgi:hypothetical protein
LANTIAKDITPRIEKIQLVRLNKPKGAKLVGNIKIPVPI